MCSFIVLFFLLTPTRKKRVISWTPLVVIFQTISYLIEHWLTKIYRLKPTRLWYNFHEVLKKLCSNRVEKQSSDIVWLWIFVALFTEHYLFFLWSPQFGLSFQTPPSLSLLLFHVTHSTPWNKSPFHPHGTFPRIVYLAALQYLFHRTENSALQPETQLSSPYDLVLCLLRKLMIRDGSKFTEHRENSHVNEFM